MNLKQNDHISFMLGDLVNKSKCMKIVQICTGKKKIRKIVFFY